MMKRFQHLRPFEVCPGVISENQCWFLYLDKNCFDLSRPTYKVHTCSTSKSKPHGATEPKGQEHGWHSKDLWHGKQSKKVRAKKSPVKRNAARISRTGPLLAMRTAETGDTHPAIPLRFTIKQRGTRRHHSHEACRIHSSDGAHVQAQPGPTNSKSTAGRS